MARSLEHYHCRTIGPREPYSYRQDPGVPSFPDDRPVIIFDGHCVLCSRWARFVLRHDRRARYRLLPAQSALGHALYVHYGLDPVRYETNILVEEGRAWFKAEGSIRMFEGLGFPWSLVRVLRLLPRKARDALYDFIARNRLRFFGRRQSCYLGEPGDEGRFLR
jgi:predicted DCC family thiol-disulfide oxidoreductase YuxK